MNKNSFKSIIALLSSILLFTSCFNTKPTTYFNDLKDQTVDLNFADAEYTIQKNDILSIFITSLNEDATKVFNTANNYVINSGTSAGGSAQSTGYLVNSDGDIQMPILGIVKAEGLTKKQLKDVITAKILKDKLLLDPIVNVRHLNYEVTVIGEVSKPTVITVLNEKMTLLKALGLAGDITIYGKKDNVLLIRERDGKKKTVRIDLNSSNFINSPYYFLQPNDVVYVEAGKNKLATTSRGLQILPTVLSGVSFLLVVAVQLFQK
jgi:polysaccharide biosynthesis/export protein